MKAQQNHTGRRFEERRRQLTDQIRKHAAGARQEGLHSVRVKHAVQCGKALLRLKVLLGRGGWGRWVQERCAVNRMTANRYIRLAGRAGLLAPSMSLREAYIAAGVITPTRSIRKPSADSAAARHRKRRHRK
jgi:hypothetical protein